MYERNPEKEKIYHLLEIFNQKNIVNGDKRSLKLEKYDISFERIVNRLISAREEYPELAIAMDEEDNYLNDFKLVTIQASNARYDAEQLKKNIAQIEKEKTEQQNRAERSEQEKIKAEQEIVKLKTELEAFKNKL